MRIEELAILTSDLDAQRDFYRGLLGLPELAGPPGSLSIAAGRSRLQFKQSPAGWSGFYHLAFNIPANQLPAAKSWLAARTDLLTTPDGSDELDFPNWEARSIYFLDPAGNILEFIARRPLANDSTRPFDAQSIVAVDEIGLVADDVLGVVHLLQQDLGATIYRSEPGAEFTALGDEHGLLIVVKRGRRWLPDLRKAAAPASLELVLENRSGARFRLSGPPYELSPSG